MGFVTTLLARSPADGVVPDDRHRLSGRRDSTSRGGSSGWRRRCCCALMGWFAPQSVPAPMAGIRAPASSWCWRYGKQFFIGSTTPQGKVISSPWPACLAGVVSILLVKALPADEHRLRTRPVRGSGQHAEAPRPPSLRSGDDPAVGYSVSYPFGVAGPILGRTFLDLALKPKDSGALGQGPRVARNLTEQSHAVGHDARRGQREAAGWGADIDPPRRAGRNEGSLPHPGDRRVRRGCRWWAPACSRRRAAAW